MIQVQANPTLAGTPYCHRGQGSKWQPPYKLEEAASRSKATLINLQACSDFEESTTFAANRKSKLSTDAASHKPTQHCDQNRPIQHLNTTKCLIRKKKTRRVQRAKLPTRGVSGAFAEGPRQNQIKSVRVHCPGPILDQEPFKKQTVLKPKCQEVGELTKLLTAEKVLQTLTADSQDECAIESDDEATHSKSSDVKLPTATCNPTARHASPTAAITFEENLAEAIGDGHHPEKDFEDTDSTGYDGDFYWFVYDNQSHF
ncbi:hypothetical protein F5Y15DRAFT_424866 [Xylariaceae sp. FL0016]|nr:hypothetical protein F5Y15DRAFT_424866 [Xylariaceae sp. FL0016]